MIEQLIARVFVTRNVTHLGHWKTDSLSKHMALGSFYDSIVDQLDTIVETYQGAFGLVGDVALNSAPPKTELIAHLKDEVNWITLNKEAIAEDNESLENLLDSLAQTYYTTIYKLTRLK